MLTDLRIHNLGVIADADIEFGTGLTVITGETGAGKTMLISSLRLLMGDRSDFSKIRRTAEGVAEEAYAEGRFATKGLPAGIRATLTSQLEECGAAADDDGSVIALRRIKADGRSRAHLGGRAVPANALTTFTEPLVSIHGQHDQLRLLKTDAQREVLDQFIGEDAQKLLTSYRAKWTEWRETANLLKQRQAEQVADARELTQLTMAVEEIQKTNLRPDEDASLQNDIRRLMDADELRDVAATALRELNGDTSYLAADAIAEGHGSSINGDSATEKIGEARGRLTDASDELLYNLGARLDETLSVLEDITSELNDFLQDLDVDPALVEEKLERQATVKQIVRKYGSDVNSVLEWATQAEKRIQELSSTENSIDALTEKEAQQRQQTAELAQQLSALRQEKSADFSTAVSGILANLAMANTEVVAEVNDIPTSARDDLNVGGRHLGEYGADVVEIKLRPSKNAATQQLSKVASGGELSRIMLAIEVVLADNSDPRTLIFDEIDSGIGGRTALEIGKCLAGLADRHQIIVVTHLPQVAAYGDHHLVVRKEAREDSAHTSVNALDSSHRVKEIARMLAGLDETETGKAHAKELLTAAHKNKAGRKTN
ncbi:MAG: DNA repair protein RecN [Lawsonella sp.]